MGANSNFAILNPLTKGTRSNLENGNLTHASTTADLAGLCASIGVFSGKWYWESYIYDSGSGYWYIGLNSGYEGGGFYAGASNLNGMVTGAIRYKDDGTVSDDSAQDDPDRWGTVTVSSTNVSTMDNGDIVMVALDFDNALHKHEKYLKQGYEGSIYRSMTGQYKGTRSWDLMKFKDFHDAEATIIGYEIGKGKRQGTLGKFIMQDHEGVEFGCPPGKGYNYKDLANMLENIHDYIGQWATFTYFERTKAGSYRHPHYKCLRNYE